MEIVNIKRKPKFAKLKRNEADHLLDRLNILADNLIREGKYYKKCIKEIKQKIQ